MLYIFTFFPLYKDEEVSHCHFLAGHDFMPLEVRTDMHTKITGLAKGLVGATLGKVAVGDQC